jgi:diamine N-acetyltransferase
MSLSPENNISLIAATPDDKPVIYQWLAHSDLTASMLGLPAFPDNLIPTWSEFDHDYAPHYFTGSDLPGGRCFIILKGGEPIGQLNYNEIDPQDNATELDIWLRSSAYAGKGYGTAAINLLCRYLYEQFNLSKIYIAPSRRNSRAIQAYRKAGFVETDIIPSWFVPDYSDTVLMIRIR